MSLDGSVFLGLILVITVAAFVALVITWPRLGGSGPPVIAARAGLLAAVNVLVLLTVATQLNSRYLFFTSWGDLLGTTSGRPASLSRGDPATRAATHLVAGRSARVGAVLPPLPPGGSVHTYTVTGPLSHVTGQIMVELPPGYASPENAATRYPVLETFAGYPGSPGQWIRSMDLGGQLAKGVAAGQVRPALIVSPQVEVPDGTDTECVNGGPGRPAIETWVADDVPDWVARTFRVAPGRASWATIGLSAGGWCAGMVALLHPAQYSAAVVMGGYFQPDFEPEYEPFDATSASAQRYDLVILAQHHPPPVAIWLETSQADPLSYGSSAAMLRAVRSPTSVQAVVLKHAGHRMSVWRPEVATVVHWLGANIPGFASITYGSGT